MIKVLFLAANPLDTDRTLLEKEFREIIGAIRMSRYRDNFDLSSVWAVRVSDLLHELNYYQPQIAHFSGHGLSAGGLQLYREGDSSLSKLLSPQQTAAIFHAWSGNIRLVILNACYSAALAELITRDIDCVIGMADEIHSEVASTFVGALYDAIGSGLSLKTAFDQGVTKIQVMSMGEEMHIPRLFTKAGIDPSQVKLIAGTLADAGVKPPQTQNRVQSQQGLGDLTKPTIAKSPILAKLDKSISIYCSYAKEDKKFYTTLRKHLAIVLQQGLIMLQQGLIRMWGSQDLPMGYTEEKFLEQLREANVVLLFVSPNFFTPERQAELDLVLSLSEQEAVRVVPIIIRRTEGWKGTAFARFYSLPRMKEAILPSSDLDDTFYHIAYDIRALVEEDLNTK